MFLRANVLLYIATQSLFHKNLNATNQMWSCIGLNFFRTLIYTNFGYPIR